MSPPALASIKSPVTAGMGMVVIIALLYNAVILLSWHHRVNKKEVFAMGVLVEFLLIALDIYIYIVIASAMVSWLIAFEVINIKNEQAANLVALLTRLTEPVYRPLRKYIPPLGGVDVTPIIVIFLDRKSTRLNSS